jgi:hypothetical protein
VRTYTGTHVIYSIIHTKEPRTKHVSMGMTDELLYRFTAGGEGIFMVEDRQTPPPLRPQIEKAKEWLPSPHLQVECQFYMKKKGKELYERLLKPLHQLYMPAIECEEVRRSQLGTIVYEDNVQVAEQK